MISVCMATYNGERYISEQLASIIACLTDGDEIIVSDDGSTDRTLDIVQTYVETCGPQIHIVDGPHRGVIANFDNALRLAQGDVLFLSDQDDIWHRDKVQKVVDTFASGDYTVVVHDATIVDAQLRPIGQTLYERRQSKPGILKNLIKNSYVGCCMAIRRDFLPYVLPLPENVEMHDWWIGLVSEMEGKSQFIKDQLIDYRRHGDNASSMHHYPLPKMVQIRCTLIRELLRRKRECIA